MSRLSALVGIVMLAVSAAAPGAAAETRIALVVGNSGYAHSPPLANPANDAADFAAVLKDAGFDVFSGLDLDRRGFDLKLRDFARALGQADVAIFFYAGHGLQVAGRNYLVPVDAELKAERDLDFEAVSLDFVLRQMELGRENKTNIVFLDACRDNPLSRSLARTMGTRSASIGQGLAQVQAGVGTFVAYSTQPGNVALDGKGRNSPFTGALTRAAREPGRSLTSVMAEVRRDVIAGTGGQQVPWDLSALTGDFYFQRIAGPGVPPKASPPTPADQAVQDRLRQLEDEVKRKASPEHTAKTVALAQARERLRTLLEQNQADQKRIFDIQYSSARSAGAPGAPSSGDVSLQIGGIQMQIGRRVQEIKRLREEIAALEKDLGIADAGKDAPPPRAAR